MISLSVIVVPSSPPSPAVRFDLQPKPRIRKRAADRLAVFFGYVFAARDLVPTLFDHLLHRVDDRLGRVGADKEAGTLRVQIVGVGIAAHVAARVLSNSHVKPDMIPVGSFGRVEACADVAVLLEPLDFIARLAALAAFPTGHPLPESARRQPRTNPVTYTDGPSEWQIPTAHSPAQNHLLAAIPSAEFERLSPHLELVEMPLGKVLYESGGRLDHVYFPTTCIVSLLYVLEDGASAEIAVVGYEGILGISLL
jgi:hypothetical protein